jgi:flagellin-like hook-associated protein FlgL
MATAQQMARDALVGIRSIHTDNTINDTVMSAASLSHQTSVNLLTNSTDKIEGVDPNEIAAKIQQAQVQLQSAFGAFATISKISLINFLA